MSRNHAREASDPGSSRRPKSAPLSPDVRSAFEDFYLPLQARRETPAAKFHHDCPPAEFVSWAGSPKAGPECQTTI